MALTYPQIRQQRVWRELRNVGVSRAAIHTMEGQYLPHIIHDGEHIGGVAYGWLDGNFSMLIATNTRVIYLDKKPLFVDEDEISYRVVSGVEISTAGLDSTVVLHTRIRNYRMHTLNNVAAQYFVNYIESRVIEQEKEEML